MAMPPLYYSTESRACHGPVAANAQDGFASVEANFGGDELLQTDVLEVIRQEPLWPPALPTGYEVSLSSMLKGVYKSVGMLHYKGEQLGSCTLISWNLGIVPCHCIEELDIRNLKGTFGLFSNSAQDSRSFSIESIVEYDQNLDYAIVRFEGGPGKEYGFVSLDPCAIAHNPPALLHHPIKKPLKVSVRPVISSAFYSNYLTTYHDSDYGSSGGAYISPSGILVAIHLGAERRQTDWNLERLALPIQKVVEVHPNGIIAHLAQHILPQADWNSGIQNLLGFSMPYVSRDYIDLENYNREMMKDFGYVVRMADGRTPGIIIDSHQKRHLPCWPTQYEGGKGSKFPQAINNDDLVTIALSIATNDPLFKIFPESFLGKKVEKRDLDKALLGNALYRKLTNPPGRGGRKAFPVRRIGIEYGWVRDRDSWEMHFYPESD